MGSSCCDRRSSVWLPVATRSSRPARSWRDLAVTYAERYFERLHFYAQTDRAKQMPWLLRLILTPEADRRALLIGVPEHLPGA